MGLHDRSFVPSETGHGPLGGYGLLGILKNAVFSPGQATFLIGVRGTLLHERVKRADINLPTSIHSVRNGQAD